MYRTAPEPPIRTRPSANSTAPRRTTILATVAGFALVATLGVGGTTVLSAGERADDAITHASDAGALGMRASGPEIRALDPELQSALDEVHEEMVDDAGSEVAGMLADRVAEEPTPAVQAAQAEQPVAGSGVFQRGTASWYGPGFAGNTTANGETYDPSQLTAAHRTLPFGTRVRVTNQHNGASVVVRINDRGPYAGNRIIDLSEAAASEIGMRSSGLAEVTLELVG